MADDAKWLLEITDAVDAHMASTHVISHGEDTVAMMCSLFDWARGEIREGKSAIAVQQALRFTADNLSWPDSVMRKP